MGESREGLLERAISGDQLALSEILPKCGGEVRQSLLGAINPQWQSQIDVDDVMQISYVEAVLHIRNCRAKDLFAFTAWLKQIARHNLQDAIRGLKRAKRPDPRKKLQGSAGVDLAGALFDLVTRDSLTASRVARTQERQQIVSKVMSSLPESYAQVLQLYDLESRTAAEVAKAMGRSEGAIYMLRARALEAMKERLGGISGIMSSSS